MFFQLPRKSYNRARAPIAKYGARTGPVADIATMFEHESLAIMDFEMSIKHDIALLRSSPAVPKRIKLYGFFYEISSGKLTEVVRDIPA